MVSLAIAARQRSQTDAAYGTLTGLRDHRSGGLPEGVKLCHYSLVWNWGSHVLLKWVTHLGLHVYTD